MEFYHTVLNHMRRDRLAVFRTRSGSGVIVRYPGVITPRLVVIYAFATAYFA
jgi:hypothetical protein